MSTVSNSITSPPETPNNLNSFPDSNWNEMPAAQQTRSLASNRHSATLATSGPTVEARNSADKNVSTALKRPNNDGDTKPSATTTGDSTDQAPPTKRTWRDQPHVGKYKLIRTLGRGNFAKVKLAQHITTKKEVAVKVIDKGQLNETSLNKLFREVSVMKQLNHPNIVKLYEVIESERHVYLVMEFASNGELFEFLVSNGRMKEKEARIKFRQIVSAVQYCHQKHIVHRDLKAENLLLDANNNIKLADFGFSNVFNTNKKLDTFCGSPPYAAPELFKGQKYVGPEVDVWSLGVILYTIVSGYLPFDATNLRDLRERVLRGKYRIPFFMSTDCEMLLKRMLVLSPEKRHSLLAVMEDKWTNIGMEDDILKPYNEPPPNYTDPVRLNTMTEMGFTLEEIKDSLENNSFNNVTATYLLLGNHSSVVHPLTSSNRNILNPTDSNSVIQCDEIEARDSPKVLIGHTSKSARSNSNSLTNSDKTKKAAAGQDWQQVKQIANSSDRTNSPSLTKEINLENGNGKSAINKLQQRTNFGGRTSVGPKECGDRAGKRPGVAFPGDSELGKPDKTQVDVGAGLKEPLKGGVRRTHTFTASATDADKRRNTVAGPRGVHKGAVGEAGVDVIGNTLVRAHNMNNIVDQLPGEDDEDVCNSRGSTPITPNSNLKPIGDHGYVEETLITPCTRAVTLRDSVAQPSSELKSRNSFWKRMRRSMMKKKKTRPEMNSPVPSFLRDAPERQTAPPRGYHTIQKDFPVATGTSQVDSDVSGAGMAHLRPRDPLDVGGTVPRYRPVSKSIQDDQGSSSPPNPDEAAAILQHSKRYRHPVQLNEDLKEIVVDPMSPSKDVAVTEEVPTEVISYPMVYSNTSFFRSFTSRISRSFRRKRRSSVQKRGDSTDSPFRDRSKTRTSKVEIATAETGDPWSPMLSKQPQSGSNVDDNDHPNQTMSGSLPSLGPLLPPCWGRKPRKIAFPKKSRLTGSDPDRLISELIAALTVSRLHFVRLGEYRLQFVFSKTSVGLAPISDETSFTPLAKIINEISDGDFDVFKDHLEMDLRVAIEVRKFLATNTYAVRFKHLSGDSRAYKLVADSLAKLIKSSTVA